MRPIKKILNDIKWNPQHKSKEYPLGYYDRVQKKIIDIPYEDIIRIDEDSMVLLDDKGEETYIPLHRIVKENGHPIWERHVAGDLK
ncbi:MAG TPA: DUF504 domain-containing protein [Candidatus Nanoarchaeia archaeon]|nr:DUF504 domain-containing protein [Candidatus Nanoarchaeia archaeon]